MAVHIGCNASSLLAAKRAESSPACVFCDGCADETAEHFTLECPAFWGLRQQLLTAIRTLVGEPKYQAWRQLPSKERLRALLGDQWWAPHTGTGDEWIQTYLLHLEQERAALLAASDAKQQQSGHRHDHDRCCTLPAGSAGAGPMA